MPLLPFDGTNPIIDQSVFVAPDAWITGKVTIAATSSVFFGAVLRGDIQTITVGIGTNIQDHAIVHSSRGMSAVVIGNNVTVGHRSIIHGAVIGDRCIIGMGATILDNTEIGDECIIGAHTLITKGTKIPPRSLVVGTPGKIIRQLNSAELEELVASAKHYQETSRKYLALFAA